MRSISYRRILAGSLFLAVAGTSSALTLGRAQGMALIGRPLDMSVQVGLDSATDVADVCAEAEVLYGDGRIEPRRVDLRVTGRGPGDTVNLRLRVATPVDEAFVTVFLHVGCQQRLSRRYVLLSEQPGDVAEAAAVATPAGPVAAPLAPAGGSSFGSGGAVSATGAPTGNRAAAAVGSDAQVAPAAAPRPSRPRSERPAPRPPVAAPAAPVAERPRLRLDTVELRPMRGASAAVAPAAPVAANAPAAAAPAASPAVLPASAVASVASAPVAAEEAQRMQALEGDLRALREAVARSNASVNEMRSRLEQAEQARYANGLVYALGGLLALASGLAGLFWWRARNHQVGTRDWWVDTPAPVVRPQVPAAPAVQPPVPPAPSTMPGALDPAAAPAAKLPGAAPVVPAVPAAPLAPAAPAPAFESFRASEPMPLSSDELSDIQQEADFFMSLGEYDRAIEVLRNHIEAHPQASAVAWLDLLEIHHKLGRRDEYEQLRRDFEWLFNARLPAFESFDQAQQGLDGQPDLLQRIQRLWPRREVLAEIDAAIFRRGPVEGSEPLGLEAYRDLLFLHNVASEILGDAAVERSGAFGASGRGASRPAALDGSGVDINLDELAPVSEVAGIPSPSESEEPNRLLDFRVDDGDRYSLPGRDSQAPKG